MSCPPVERIKADKSYESDQFGNNAKKMKLVDEQFEKCCEAALNCEKSYQTYKESVESTCQMKIKTATGIVESKACGFCLEKLSEKRIVCSQCSTIGYCDANCQEANWI